MRWMPGLHQQLALVALPTSHHGVMHDAALLWSSGQCKVILITHNLLKLALRDQVFSVGTETHFHKISRGIPKRWGKTCAARHGMAAPSEAPAADPSVVLSMLSTADLPQMVRETVEPSMV